MCLTRYKANIHTLAISKNGALILRKRFTINECEMFADFMGIRYKWSKAVDIDGCEYFAKRNNRTQDVQFGFQNTIGIPIHFYKKRILGYHTAYFDKELGFLNKRFSQLTRHEVRREVYSVDFPVKVHTEDIQDFDEDSVVTEKFYLLSKEELIRFFKEYQEKIYDKKDLLTDEGIHSFANNYEILLDRIGEV